MNEAKEGGKNYWSDKITFLYNTHIGEKNSKIVVVVAVVVGGGGREEGLGEVLVVVAVVRG